MKVIAVRYQNSQIVFIEEYETVASALGVINDANHELLNVGYGPEWTVYLVDGSDWYELSNYSNSGVRYDFMQFLHRLGGTFAGFDVENFEAPDREDF